MTIPKSEGGLFSAGICLPSDPAEEKKVVDELEAAAVAGRKEGDVYYIVSGRWWREWQDYVQPGSVEKPIFSESDSIPSTPSRPGQIDNSELILKDDQEENGELMLSRDLMEGPDYVFVCKEAWEKLAEWYGGGPALSRKLIADEGMHGKNWTIEVRPFSLKLIDARDNTKRVLHLSRKDSIRELYNRVCTLLKLEQSKIRIWDYFNEKKSDLLDDFEMTIEDALVIDREILLEVDDDQSWSSNSLKDSTGNDLALVCLEPSRTSTSIAGGPTLSNGYTAGSSLDAYNGNGSYAESRADHGNSVCSPSKVNDRGLTGLHNLGNTCFMNSAIQCLAHTPPLVEYFIKDYSEEINEDNPLGMRGELALAFGELLRKLWSSGRTPVAPRAFKAKLALFAPQFSGYNQHDSQELLAFLLDGLHEDLNRVKNKPYIEAKDADGRPDAEFAEECWENHKARNNSIVVDTCQGQYKSTLVCPVCSKVSVTFDPFMYLSLPLPSTATRTLTITLFYSDGRTLPMPYTVTVPKQGCCKDLIQSLTNACCLKNDETLLLAEVYEHHIYRYCENPSESLSIIKDEDRLVAYVLPKHQDNLLRVEILHQSKDKATFYLQSNGYRTRELVGTPVVTCLADDIHTEEHFQAAIETVLKPLMRASKVMLNQVRTATDECSTIVNDVTIEDDDDPCSMDEDEEDISSNLETEESTVRFQIALTDDRASTCTPFSNVNGSRHRYNKCIKILLNWTDRERSLYDFSFLDNLPEVCKSGFPLKKTRPEAITLFHCLDAFLKEEPLGPDDMWFCPKCKEHRQATKKLDLWRLPEILVIHLKRFSYSRFFKNKLDIMVNFPIHNLDMGKYLSHGSVSPQSQIYELYAVSNHYGGLGGGHYTAYAKLINENSWYHFDDSHVSPVGEESIKTHAAYVLFYRRVNSAEAIRNYSSSEE